MVGALFKAEGQNARVLTCAVVMRKEQEVGMGMK